MGRETALTGSQAFLPSTRLDLDKPHAVISKKTADGSGEAVSVADRRLAGITASHFRCINTKKAWLPALTEN
jgi:hypothetical protein